MKGKRGLKGQLRRGTAMLLSMLLLIQMTGCAKSSNSMLSEDIQNSTSSSAADSGYSSTKADTVSDMTMEASEKSTTAGIMSDGAAAEWVLPEENPDWNTEEYNAITENGFQSVAKNPLSTFSADVDTASYSNVRRLLMAGSNVDPGAVRIEEMINYFSYDYKEPEAGEPFGVTMEMSDCPWDEDTKLLMLGLKTEDLDRSMAPHSNLVFLLDVSGSMYDEDKLPLVQKAFQLLTDNLSENDRISIVTYAGSDQVVLEGVCGDQKEKIMDAVNSLEASGSTAGSAGIQTAYQIAEKYFIKGGNNRIILATDGDLNVGITSTSELTELVQQKRESGVYLSVLGFGTGNIKDDKMEALADNGNGNYSYIDSIKEAKKVLVEEMGANLVTVAEDVKFQVEFNPQNVKGYRLIGYENRVLENQDFEDDTKDAGEIGAGHTVTVLYEIIPVDSDKEVYEPTLKYQSEEKVEIEEEISKETTTIEDSRQTTMLNEYATLSIRYKKPGEHTSNLLSYEIKRSDETDTPSKDFRFAAAVAEFGMLLRNSEYCGNITYRDILSQLDKNYADEYKQEFLSLVSLASTQFIPE